MRDTLSLSISPFIAIGAVYSHIYSNQYAENLIFFVCWVFIVIGFILLPAKSADIFKRVKNRMACKIFSWIMCASLISIGWSFTGICYLIVEVFMQIKYMMYKDELNAKQKTL